MANAENYRELNYMNVNEIIRNPACLNDSLNRTIHKEDQMYTGNENRYMGVGADAITKICALFIDREAPKSILDFACGYGRVARFLSSAFPASELVVSDVMQSAVDFCAKEFNATPILSDPDFGDLNIERKFSLIWSGSLLTHLSEEKSIQLLAFFERHLEENGIALFTIHGRYAAQKWKTDRQTIQLKESDGKKLSSIYARNEFAYADYPHMTDYGMSLTPLSWLVEKINDLPSLRIVSLVERGWDNHQDILGVMKAPIHDPWKDINPKV